MRKMNKYISTIKKFDRYWEIIFNSDTNTNFTGNK